MGAEQTITEKELWIEFQKAAGSQFEPTEFMVVYAWKERFLDDDRNYALAFHPKQTSVWTLNLESGCLREIPIKDIRSIKEEPSCCYRFFYRHSIRWESFFVPYISVGTKKHFRCVQMDAGKRFQLFCKKFLREPLIGRIIKLIIQGK